MTHPARLVGNRTNGAKVRQEFGGKIHELRKRLSLSAEQFSSIVGVNPSSICFWEKGQHLLSQQSYDMLTDKYSELKTTEVEELIVLKRKPVGKPKGLPQSPRKVNGKHASPTFPQVRNGRKEPEQLKLEIQEAKNDQMIAQATLAAASIKTATRNVEELAKAGIFVHSKLAEELNNAGVHLWGTEKERLWFLQHEPVTRAILLLSAMEEYDEQQQQQETEPPHTNKQDVASLLINSKTLAELLALDIKNKHGRAEAIKHLRAAGATDDFILDVVHEALP